MNPNRLLSELKRRRVFRVAGVYLVAGWAAIQAASAILPMLEAPAWVGKVVLAFVALGFPLALVLAWAFDVTPEGVERTMADPAMDSPRAGADLEVGGGPAAPARTVRRRRLALVALGLLLLAVGAFAAWQRGARPAPLSAGTIAVLPFSVGGNEEAKYLGDGLVHLLATNLDGAGELRTVDSRSVLNAVGREGASGAPDAPTAQRVAARLGAGFYVLGEVVAIGEQVRIAAALYDAADPGEPVGRASIEGDLAQPFDAIDRLSAQLLAALSHTPTASLADVTTRSLPALKAYLAGEAAFRVADLDGAITTMRRAVAQDSTFALAHYRLALASAWMGMPDRAQASIERAVVHSGRLSARDRRLVEALDAFLGGRAEEAERVYRALLDEYPQDVEAWYMLGETLFHYNSLHGRPEDARDAFEAALSYQPEHANSLLHAAQLAQADGARAAFDSLTRRMLAQPSDPRWAAGVRALRAFGLEDSAARRAVLEELRAASDDYVAYVATMVTGGEVQIGAILSDPARAPGTRSLGHTIRVQARLARGQPRTARAELDALEALDPTPGIQERALLALAPVLPHSRAALDSLRRDVERWDPARSPRATGGAYFSARHQGEAAVRVYLLGLLSAGLGEADRALRYAAELDAMPEPTDASSLASDLAASVRAEVARQRGDLAGALAHLGTARREARWDIRKGSTIHTQSRERFLQGELAQALGRDDEALRWFTSLSYSPSIYQAPAHLRRAEIHDRRGERERAVAAYARFVELWEACDPELRPLVDQARARLARLAGEPSAP